MDAGIFAAVLTLGAAWLVSRCLQNGCENG